MTTNHIEVLDPALIRPGRIDLQFHLEEFDSYNIQRTIKKFTGFDIEVPPNLKMSSSTLINRILLPNRNDKNKIVELLK
jgi:ATP-dependent 26S proteasome regulatory subunit